MSRFTDDMGLVAPDQYVPTSLPALLRHLHLKDAPQAEQEDAVRIWLRSHKPGALMVHSLQKMGFGHLLDRRATA